METIRTERLIQLATDTVDLAILRRLTEQAEQRRPLPPSAQQQLKRLTRARDLLTECNTRVVQQ